MSKKALNIVWFKRDLRFADHEPLFMAQQSDLPVLLLYFFEPSVMNYDDADVRHWRFIYESIQNMQRTLEPIGGKIYTFHTEVMPVFETLSEHFLIKNVFSHQEIGNKVTYDRDIEMDTFFKVKGISWQQSQLHGVIRKLASRKNWDQRWEAVMKWGAGSFFYQL